jgi:hypothetical protein
MIQTPPARWLTPIAIAVAAAIFLIAFQADLPNGDGRVYLRQITAGHFVWNPNHLLMEPIGLVWFRLTQVLGTGWSLFGALKVLAGISAIAATLIFYRTAATAAGGAPLVALIATAGLFFSAHFVGMAIAEEFFIVQMPVVAGALWWATRWACSPAPADPRAPGGRPALVAAGALTGLATAVAINNAFLALGLGVGACLATRGAWSQRVLNAVTVWAAGVAVAGPVYLAAGLSNDSGQTFLQWLLSYQGTADNPAEVMFRVQMTPVGLAISLATAAYGSVSSLVSPGELGSALEPVVRGRPLEFVPDTTHLAITGLLLVALAGVLLPAALWLIRRGRRAPLEIVCLAWLIGYAGFNLYWVDTSDQFFITQLPAFWLLLLLFVRSRLDAAAQPVAPATAAPRRWTWAMAVAVALLAAVNLQAVVAPRAFMDIESRHAAFAALLRPGDLIVTTGWDDLAWLRVDPGEPYERLQLMDLVLRARKGDPELDQLPARARAHVAAGRRVLVARLFDRDREGRPWEDLDRLRWPRPRLQALFKDFEAVPLGRVDAVVVRELRPRAGP